MPYDIRRMLHSPLYLTPTDILLVCLVSGYIMRELNI